MWGARNRENWEEHIANNERVQQATRDGWNMVVEAHDCERKYQSYLEELRVNTYIWAGRCSAGTSVYHDTIAGKHDEVDWHCVWLLMPLMMDI